MRDESDEFTHGPFKVIPLKGVQDATEAVECLDKSRLSHLCKFPKVLYGKVFIEKT